MNDKMMSGAGCLLLLAAALAPTALGHDDNGSRSGDVDDGVAGTFYGAAGYYVAFDGTTVGIPDPIGPIDPDFYEDAAKMECDMEVLGDGTSEQEPDEGFVEGVRVEVGAVRDGTFDDGGLGGACHTNHYISPYDTPGCDDDGARASNLAPFAAWIGAACDWKTTEGGTPQSDILTGCLVNGILYDLDKQPAETVACGIAFIECTPNPLTCLSDGVELCGSDFVQDGINFGAGSSRVAYPYMTPVGMSFATDGLGCPQDGATMSVFVFNGVQVTAGVVVTINPAIQGDIWQVA